MKVPKLFPIFLLSLAFTSIPNAARAACTADTIGITLCTPTDATLVSPVHMDVAAKGEAAIARIELRVDDVHKQVIAGDSLDVLVAIPRGRRKITLTAWDVNGKTYTRTEWLTVDSVAQTTPCPTGGDGVNICSPETNFSDAPVRLRAGLGSGARAAWRVYLDSTEVYGGGDLGGVDTLLYPTRGYRHIVVNSWTPDGKLRQASKVVYVNGPFANCALNQWSPSVSICAPSSGATVSSGRVRVLARYISPSIVTYARIYINGVAVYGGEPLHGATDITIPIATGRHHMTVNAWDAAGRVFTSSTYVNSQ